MRFYNGDLTIDIGFPRRAIIKLLANSIDAGSTASGVISLGAQRDSGRVYQHQPLKLYIITLVRPKLIIMPCSEDSIADAHRAPPPLTPNLAAVSVIKLPIWCKTLQRVLSTRASKQVLNKSPCKLLIERGQRGNNRII